MTKDLSHERPAARVCTAVCATALALLTTAPSLAESLHDLVPTQTVTYADLDISKPAGARVLYHRIEEAADRVCQPRVLSERRLRDVTNDCVTRAVNRAVQHVGSPALADLHAVRTLRVAAREPLTAHR